ncbi:MAG: 50S ribosomal protein L4 [Candidatus Paraimprobicoccus trichonymphae]|uniref:Large ribosomal subunit protein uL4 n=1 Tax=Candidatus Paraimprobicoccus trichonymphae TaxID=3033793 RepID=A0AA48HZP9_9FIRM|nr:MAG: 50S ribosomal protein L4 [Candidatus Paraimprobicoccus trichonymphae]
MPSIEILDISGNKLEGINLSDDIFGIEPNMSVMHEAVVNYLANQRQGNQSALTRSEVSGGGKKPWRQKGTGRARQGSIRSPQWVHGGIVFPPKPRSYRYSLNKKVKRLALKSAFSSKFKNNELIVLDNIVLEEYKTKFFVNVLNNLKISKKALFVLSEVNDKIIKSSRNISGIKTTQVNTLNTYDVLNSGKLILIKDSVKKIEEVYS